MRASIESAPIERLAIRHRDPRRIEDLEKEVEHAGMRLFDFVAEQRAALTELPAQQQPDALLRLILRHIEAEQVIQIHDKLGERNRHFRFPDAGRAEEKEAAERTARLSQPELTALKSGRDPRQRVILPANLTAQVTLQRAEFRKLVFVVRVHRFGLKT